MSDRTERTARITNHRNGSVTISGLTRGDTRLLANAVDAGAFEGGDRGGEVSKALLRLASLLRTPGMFPTLHSPVEFVTGSADATRCYQEVERDR